MNARISESEEEQVAAGGQSIDDEGSKRWPGFREGEARGCCRDSKWKNVGPLFIV